MNHQQINLEKVSDDRKNYVQRGQSQQRETKKKYKIVADYRVEIKISLLITRTEKKEIVQLKNRSRQKV